MAERKTLFDAIFVRGMDLSGAAQTAPAFGVFSLAQMPPAGARAQHFAARGDLESFGGGLFGLNAFGTSHNENSFLSKRARNIGCCVRGSKR
jgi:hypothetical protein